jgi:hypothetical protein
MVSYSNPWVYNHVEFDSDMIVDHVAFVYIITNTTNNKKYIGKKIFFNTRRVKQNNKTRRKVVKQESDWKEYYGSNITLQNDIESIGKDKFKREIIHLCTKKSLASYYEAREQFLSNCLFSLDHYNDWISCKVTRKHLNGACE